MATLERATGRVVEERMAFAAAFAWLHARRPVRAWFYQNPWLHHLLGWYADARPSRCHIPWFVRHFDVDMTRAVIPPGGFRSFNDFFGRALRTDPPLDRGRLFSPAQGRLSLVENLTSDGVVRVKQTLLGIDRLLGDAALAQRLAGGTAAILRLYLPDCHRLYFPCDGTVSATWRIAGSYAPLSPFPGNDRSPLLCNHRAVTVFEAAEGGRMAFVDVGGFLVSSIRPLGALGRPARAGDARTWFAFGGSTHVMLTEAGRVRFDSDLLAWSRAGHEVRVEPCEPIARMI